MPLRLAVFYPSIKNLRQTVHGNGELITSRYTGAGPALRTETGGGGEGLYGGPYGTGGVAMRRGKTLTIGLTAAVLGLVLVLGILVSTACSCLPTIYQEVELAAVPDRVLENARNLAPGIVFARAWRFSPGGRFETEGIEGYLLRGWPHWYESRDVEVFLSGLDRDPEHLEPIK